MQEERGKWGSFDIDVRLEEVQGLLNIINRDAQKVSEVMCVIFQNLTVIEWLIDNEIKRNEQSWGDSNVDESELSRALNLLDNREDFIIACCQAVAEYCKDGKLLQLKCELEEVFSRAKSKISALINPAAQPSAPDFHLDTGPHINFDSPKDPPPPYHT